MAKINASKHCIRKKLIGIAVSLVFAMVCTLLAAIFFRKHETALKIFSAYNRELLWGLSFKWPVVFIIGALIFMYSTVVLIVMSVCQFRYRSRSTMMQASEFKQKLPWIAAVILFLLPEVSRLCIGTGAFNPHTGCIVGLEEPYLELFRWCSLSNMIHVFWLTIFCFYYKMPFPRLKSIASSLILCMSLLASCTMICLNLRTQRWLAIPYAFVIIVLIVASVFVFRRLKGEKKSSM